MKNEHIEALINELGYDTTKPEQILYKYVDISTAERILNTSTLLYQSPEKFNDPLDPHLGLLNIHRYLLNNLRDLYGRYPPQDLYQENKIALQSALKRLINNSGILCLSERNDVTLMWSHYANKHTGVCLGFRGLKQNDGQGAVKVRYTNEFKPLPFVEPISRPENIAATINLFCTKASAWEYEKEVRLISYNNYGLRPFAIELLKEVYFGVNTTKDHIALVKEILKKKEYSVEKIQQMALQENNFDLNCIDI